MSFLGNKSAISAHHTADRTEARTQYAALCYRVLKDKPEILLITSRETRRWIIPKGWPMPDRSPAQAALQEAYEEAGVQGEVDERCIGVFSYMKNTKQGYPMPCFAMVFPVRVTAMTQKFPERGQRRRRWLPRKKAAQLVQEPELAQMLRDFDPRKLR